MAACCESFISSDGAAAGCSGDGDDASNAGVSGTLNGASIITNGDNETKDEDHKEFCDHFEFVVSKTDAQPQKFVLLFIPHAHTHCDALQAKMRSITTVFLGVLISLCWAHKDIGKVCMQCTWLDTEERNYN